MLTLDELTEVMHLQVQKVLTLWTVAGVKLRGQAFGETILTFPNSDQLELMRILETENALSASISTPASALDVRDRDLHDQSSSDLKHQLQALQHELVSLYCCTGVRAK